MEKEVMDALCMLHSLAKKDTTYTTQDEQFNIIKKYIEKQQKEIERLNEIINSRYYHDLKCRELEKDINENWENKIKEKIKEIESYAFTSKEEKNQQDYAIERIRELLEENK